MRYAACLLFLLLLLGCGPVTTCDVEATLCIAEGGTWTPGPNCGVCEWPEPNPAPPEPNPTPAPPEVPGWLPTAAQLAAAGARVEIRPMREGRKGVGATPWAVFGEEHYCRPEVNWPEACAAGRDRGPIAPDGHPHRAAWEAHFLGQPCASFSYESTEHMSFDPWIVQGGVNQNHPRNVEVCGQAQFEPHESWTQAEYHGHLYIIGGQWSWATAHGNGEVCAEAAGGVGRTCKPYEEG